MTRAEAAGIVGVDEARIGEFQAKGWIPDPIPDDFFDAFISFRLAMESVHERKVRMAAANVSVAKDVDVEG